MCQFANCPPRLDGRFFYDYFMAGSVAMYCRQHGYPTARLISYKITGIGTLWEVVVPLCRLSTFLAQGPNLRHYVISSNHNRCGLVTTSSPALPLTSGKRFPIVTLRQTSATLCIRSPGHTPTLKTTWGTPSWSMGNACDTFRTGLHLGAPPPGCV